jgi:hypothetical protein
MREDESRFAPPPDDLPPIPDDDNTDDVLEDALEALAPEPESILEPEPIRITAEPPSINVDEALAAVSGLDVMLAQQEAEERAEEERLETERRAEEERLETERRAKEEQFEQELDRFEVESTAEQEEAERILSAMETPMNAPQPLMLRRGSAAAVLPGMALVGVGVWLTYANATESAPPTSVVTLALVGIIILALFSTWLSTGRWNRGALFLALWVTFTAGALATSRAIVPGALLALGGALLLTAILARPVSMKFALPGGIVLVAGGVAAALTLNVIPPIVVNTLSAGWVVVAVLAAILLLLPAVNRIRR